MKYHFNQLYWDKDIPLRNKAFSLIAHEVLESCQYYFAAYYASKEVHLEGKFKKSFRLKKIQLQEILDLILETGSHDPILFMDDKPLPQANIWTVDRKNWKFHFFTCCPEDYVVNLSKKEYSNLQKVFSKHDIPEDFIVTPEVGRSIRPEIKPFITGEKEFLDVLTASLKNLFSEKS